MQVVRVDVTIGAGAVSKTTVAGVLQIDGNAIYDDDTALCIQFDSSGNTEIKNKFRADIREFNVPGTSDGDHAAGDVVFFGGTESMTAGKIYYYTSGGAWAEANAGADATATGLLAIALGSSSNNDGMLLRGMVTPSAPAGSDDEGKKVYLRATDGAVTTTAPSSSGNFVRIVGYMLHASNDLIYFCPDNTYVEIA